MRAIKLGAADYFLKPVDDAALISTIRSAVRAKPSERPAAQAISVEAIRKLTERQLQVLALVGDGLTSKQIAQRLEVSHRTIEVHRAHIMRVLTAKTAADLIRISILNKDILDRFLPSEA